MASWKYLRQNKLSFYGSSRNINFTDQTRSGNFPEDCAALVRPQKANSNYLAKENQTVIIFVDIVTQ